MMCRLLEVSASGFYERRSRGPSARELADQALTERIREIHVESRQTYGAPRIHAELGFAGVRVGKKRVARLMRQAQISGLFKVKRGKTTISVPGIRTAPDVVDRDFLASGPNKFWVADITYIRTWEGWLYLAAVTDLFSRCVVGWSMDNNMRSELVVEALEMAVAARRPEPGLIHHSDRGSQYTALIFDRRCKLAGINMSMSGKGAPHDNAVAESFFSSLKKDLIYRQSWHTRAEARAAIFDYIEVFYNRKRRHSTLGMLSPEEFEMINQPTAQAAVNE
jgi:putative transposase